MFCFLIPGIFWLLSAYNNTGDSLLVDKVLKTSNLIALWTFEEDSGIPRLSLTNQSLALLEGDKPIPKIDDGPLSGSSILLDGSSYLSIPNKKTGSLNISGPGSHVTLIAWVKWSGEQTGFVGGMWNEYQDGGKRQYGLFVSLPYYNGKDQVCGHVSYSGKATPPFLIQWIILLVSKWWLPMNGFASLLPMMELGLSLLLMANLLIEKKN